MALITWLKTQNTRRRKKKTYTTFRTDASPPPLSRKNTPRLYTPNYSSPSSPRPPSRSVSPHTTPHRTSEPTPAVSSKRTSSISQNTTSPLTPPESTRSEVQSWTTYSESSLRGNKGSDIRSPRDSASVGPVALIESAPKRGRSPGRNRGGNSGAIPTPPQTPIPSSSPSGNDDEGAPDQSRDYGTGDVHIYAPTLLDSDPLCTLASRKKELVELFTLHGPVYGEEWRLRGAHYKTREPGDRTATEDIGLVNEELMSGYASGGEGCSEMWTLLSERC